MVDTGRTYKAAPKFVGPDVSVPGEELFEPPPFKVGEIASHIVGATLNGVVCVSAGVFLIYYAEPSLGAWTSTAVAVVAATYLADLASGLLHWTFDTWFDESRLAVRRMVLLVREHHIYPQRIFKYGLKQEFGLMSWFGLFGAAPMLAAAALPPGPPTNFGYALATAAIIFSLEVAFSLELHKVGHRFDRGPVIRKLQSMHMLLSPEHHMQHHSREHDGNYCLVNGIADLTVGRLGLFRALEFVVSKATGEIPRENDRQWRRGFGRWVASDQPRVHRHLTAGRRSGEPPTRGGRRARLATAKARRTTCLSRRM